MPSNSFWMALASFSVTGRSLMPGCSYSALYMMSACEFALEVAVTAPVT